MPMRDGVKLYTVIYTPMGDTKPVPILITRTPYGVYNKLPNDTVINAKLLGPAYILAKEGYVFVYQDIRGKYKSEGHMEIHQPLIHTTQKSAIDESTDTYAPKYVYALHNKKNEYTIAEKEYNEA